MSCSVELSMKMFYNLGAWFHTAFYIVYIWFCAETGISVS